MDESTVVFRVDGEEFELLQQTVRAKPDTLLCTLLDDPAREKDDSKPIFVQADKQRFRYILDWYKYGRICIPATIGMEEMRRECAFFQLPDEVQITRDNMLGAVFPLTVDTVASCAHEARARWKACATACAATYLYQSALNSKTWNGSMSVSVVVDLQEHQLIQSQVQGCEIIRAAEQLAAQDGFSLAGRELMPWEARSAAASAVPWTNGCPTCKRVQSRRFKIDLAAKRETTEEQPQRAGSDEQPRGVGRSGVLATGLQMLLLDVLQRQEAQAWEQAWSKSEEAWFWYHRETGTTQWETPQAVQDSKLSAASHRQQGGDSAR